MGKAPAFQFYVRDWLSDPQLRMASASTRGIWIDCLCFMWESKDRGTLHISRQSLARMTGASDAEIDLFFEEAKCLNFCDISDYVSVTCHAQNVTVPTEVTLKNRRMAREQSVRNQWRTRKQRQRSKEDVTQMSRPHSSSSSSSSKKKQTKRGANAQASFARFWSVWLKKVDKQKALQAWTRLNPSEELIQTICQDVRRRMASEAWTKDDRQFCPGPAVYLKNRRWEDEDPAPGKPEPNLKLIPSEEFLAKEMECIGISKQNKS